MNSKEKRKILLIITFFTIIFIIIYFLYNYTNKKVVYANNSEIKNIDISNAEKIDIENIILQNTKKNTEQIITEEVNIEYITQYKNNSELPKGVIQVLQEGRTGKQQIVKKKIIDENGQEHEEILSTTTVIGVVNKIVEVGTSDIKKEYKITKGCEVYVTSDRVDVKAENNNQSRKKTTLTKNTILKVLEIDGDWCKISQNGQTGWVKTQNIASIYSNPNFIKDDNNKVDFQYSFDMAIDKPSGLSLEQFKKVLTDSKDTNSIFCDNAEYFYYIEKQYDINGLFVAAIGIHESGWGTSKIAINKRNLFGYKAYDSNPYNSASYFDTYAEGIDLIARVLVKYYLNPRGTTISNGETAVGTYYNGNTISAVNKKYATDKAWAEKVYSHMEYLYKKL